MDMYTFNHSMTVVFNKRTGDIKGIFQGEQTIDTLYGHEAEDFKLIFDAVTTGINTMVRLNPMFYKVNPVTKAIEAKNNI